MKTNVYTKTFMQMWMAALFTIVKKWKLQKCPSLTNDYTGCSISCNGLLFSNKKEETIDTCRVADKLQKYAT